MSGLKLVHFAQLMEHLVKTITLVFSKVELKIGHVASKSRSQVKLKDIQVKTREAIFLI